VEKGGAGGVSEKSRATNCGFSKMAPAPPEKPMKRSPPKHTLKPDI